MPTYTFYNKKTKQMKVIGACCIEKFNLGGRTCAICGDEHNNRKNNYCNNCRKGICDDCYKPLKNTNYKIITRYMILILN